MAISSIFGYMLTFLSAMAILVLIVGILGYYTQPGGGGDELLPTSTLLLLDEYFPYVLLLSLIIVIGEWAYARPRKRKYKEEKYGALDRGDDESAPPMR